MVNQTFSVLISGEIVTSQPTNTTQSTNSSSTNTTQPTNTMSTNSSQSSPTEDSNTATQSTPTQPIQTGNNQQLIFVMVVAGLVGVTLITLLILKIRR